jgi:hypothetical protein
MFRNRLFALVGGVVFLIVSLAGLYRLLFGFSIRIGDHIVGQMPSFFIFVIFAALTVIAFQQVFQKTDDGR